MNRKYKLILTFLFLFNFISCHIHMAPKRTKANIQLSSKFENRLLCSKEDVILLGENHYHTNVPFQIGLLDLLGKKSDTILLGLEYSVCYEGLINDYINQKDLRIFELMRKGKMARYPTKQSIELIKRLRNQYEGKLGHVKVFCFDIPPTSIIPVLEILRIELSSVSRINELPISKYLFSEKKDIYFELRSLIITNELLAHFNEHVDLYKEVLQDKFDFFEEIVQGMEIEYGLVSDSLEKKYIKREKYMSDIVLKRVNQFDSYKKIIFTGGFHASKLAGDPDIYGNHCNSMALLLQESNITVLSINLNYYHWFRSRANMDYLDASFLDSMEIMRDYMVLTKKQLKLNIEEQSRFDISVIINCSKN